MPLVGYWPLHEDSGGTAYDLAGGNDGTVNGATQGASGILGETAYDFDGTDDYVNTGLAFDKYRFTYSAWVNVDSFDSSGPNDIIDCLEDTSSEWARLGLSEGDFYFVIDNNDEKTDAVGPAVQTGTWYHVVGIYDQNEIFLYVDGDLEASTNISSNGTIEGIEPEYIGSASVNDSEHFDGKICEVRVYDHALTPSEVQYLYNVAVGDATFTTGPRVDS